MTTLWTGQPWILDLSFRPTRALPWTVAPQPGPIVPGVVVGGGLVGGGSPSRAHVAALVVGAAGGHAGLSASQSQSWKNAVRS